VARAQQVERLRRVGLLITVASREEESLIASFEKSLEALGWVEGRNVTFYKRLIRPTGEGTTEYAKELVGLKPDILVAGPTNAVLALQRETSTIPIVFVVVSDALEQGIVRSLARPGGNLTGFSTPAFLLVGRTLQMFKEMEPGITRVEALFSPTSPVGPIYFRAAEVAAKPLAIKMIATPVSDRAEIEHTIVEFGREPNGGLYMPPDPVTISNRDLIVDLAARYRLPAVYGRRIFVDGGGLMSFDRTNRAEDYRGAAAYVDRILRGEKPGDLPVQQPTKYETVLNLKTAKALGLTIPETLLATADEVIQ
jgi:putative ABC transport system substrate-binding protein